LSAAAVLAPASAVVAARRVAASIVHLRIDLLPCQWCVGC
jgi:hypothetical protein